MDHTTWSAVGAAVTNDTWNELPSGNRRVPSVLGVSAAINPLAKPPDVVDRSLQAIAAVDCGIEPDADAGAER
ncbi:hypothetical protein [Trinickia symbiotica]|uniref:hypothetical protein n=1 Tax=Trinickia symbiotica TaxID=863227 RepID=UPI0015E66FF2|nr:hypothetical protein [Trinickia symbiotica]